MQRARISITYHSDKEPTVEITGELIPDDIPRMRYYVQQEYFKYVERAGAANKKKIAEEAQKKATALAQANSALDNLLKNPNADLVTLKFAANEVLKLDGKHKTAMEVLARADKVINPTPTV